MNNTGASNAEGGGGRESSPNCSPGALHTVTYRYIPLHTELLARRERAQRHVRVVVVRMLEVDAAVRDERDEGRLVTRRVERLARAHGAHLERENKPPDDARTHQRSIDADRRKTRQEPKKVRNGSETDRRDCRDGCSLVVKRDTPYATRHARSPPPPIVGRQPRASKKPIAESTTQPKSDAPQVKEDV